MTDPAYDMALKLHYTRTKVMILKMKPYKVWLLTALLMIPMGRSAFAESKSFFTTDIIMHKDIHQDEGTILYRHIFKSNIDALNIDLNVFPREARGSSWTTQMRNFENDERGRGSRVNQAWSNMSGYIQKNLKSLLISSGEASVPSISGDHSTSAPIQSNHFSPKVSVGKNYVKPTICVENSLNADIQTEVSYDSRYKDLQTALSKKISQDVELTVINHNLFSQTNDKRVVLGFKYSF